jgi:hypothetical protein
MARCRVEKEPDAITARPVAIKALEASKRKPVDEKQPEIIEVKGATEPEGEPLELVEPPPELPEPFRDRGRW